MTQHRRNKMTRRETLGLANNKEKKTAHFQDQEHHGSRRLQKTVSKIMPVVL